MLDGLSVLSHGRKVRRGTAAQLRFASASAISL
jgi:hypothetical protein